MTHRSSRTKSTAPLVAAALIAAGSVAACNVIAGVGDFAVGDVPEAGAAIDSAVPTGNDTGPPADAGPDTSDAAVACGDGLPTTPAFEQLVKACVLWAGCTGYLSAVSISNCITWDWLGSNTNNSALLCLAAATTCAGVTNCTGEAWATSAQCPATTSTTQQGTCSGTTAVNCVHGAGTAVNCAKQAGTSQCGTYGLPNDGGVAAGCVVKPTCPTDAGTAFQCDTPTNTLFECINGVGYGESCTPFGNTCATFSGTTSCYVQGPTPCGNPGKFSCTDDTTIDFCADTQTQITLHCGVAGGTCQGTGSTTNCVAPGCTLSASQTCKESCGTDKRTAHLCVGGAPYDFDCKSMPDFANGGCVLQSNGYATCVPH